MDTVMMKGEMRESIAKEDRWDGELPWGVEKLSMIRQVKRARNEGIGAIMAQ